MGFVKLTASRRVLWLRNRCWNITSASEVDVLDEFLLSSTLERQMPVLMGWLSRVFHGTNRLQVQFMLTNTFPEKIPRHQFLNMYLLQLRLWTSVCRSLKGYLGPCKPVTVIELSLIVSVGVHQLSSLPINIGSNAKCAAKQMVWMHDICACKIASILCHLQYRTISYTTYINIRRRSLKQVRYQSRTCTVT